MDIFTIILSILSAMYFLGSIVFFKKMSYNFEYFEKYGVITIVLSLVIFILCLLSMKNNVSIIEYIIK